MTTAKHEFTGWNCSDLTILTGPAPQGTVSLRDLADPNIYARHLPLFVALAGGKRQGALTIVHYAVYLINTVLIALLVFDHFALDIPADQLGLVLDETGGLTAAWVGQVTRLDPDRPAASVGTLSMRLLAPITELSRQAGRVSARAVTNITLDALSSGCRRLENAAGQPNGYAWVDELIAACGHPEYQPGRPLFVQPDDEGPSVEFRVPKTCCVLNKQAGPHACPTCPQLPDDATRTQRIGEWLKELDDREFNKVAGRERVGKTR